MGRVEPPCPEAGIEWMPMNISPRYKKNYKGTNKTWGLCQCEKWRRCSCVCVLPRWLFQLPGPVGLQPRSPAPVLNGSRRFIRGTANRLFLCNCISQRRWIVLSRL